MKLNVLLNDPIVVHCLGMESFMPMSVVIVMKSYSGVYIVQLKINPEDDKIYFTSFNLIYKTIYWMCI